MEVSIEKASEIIKKGGIVIYPTDTAYGIGCRIDNESSIKRLFDIRKRPYTRATPILCSDIMMVKKYCKDIPSDVEEKLMNKYWPGALTIILDAKSGLIPVLVRGGTETIGIRIPDSIIARTLIGSVKIPLIGTSANFHGEKTPYTFSELNPLLLPLVDGVVIGGCKLKRESTVIDCTKSPWLILRQGAVEIEI